MLLRLQAEFVRNWQVVMSNGPTPAGYDRAEERMQRAENALLARYGCDMRAVLIGWAEVM